MKELRSENPDNTAVWEAWKARCLSLGPEGGKGKRAWDDLNEMIS